MNGGGSWDACPSPAPRAFGGGGGAGLSPILSTSPKTSPARQQASTTPFVAQNNFFMTTPDGGAWTEDRKPGRRRNQHGQRQAATRSFGGAANKNEDLTAYDGSDLQMQPGQVETPISTPPTASDPPSESEDTAEPAERLSSFAFSGLTLPVHSFPAPDEVRVRNTFIESPTKRSSSLDRFYKERQVKSQPTSGPPSGKLEFAGLHPTMFDFEAVLGRPPFIATPASSDVDTAPGTPRKVLGGIEAFNHCLATRPTDLVTDSGSVAGSTTAESLNFGSVNLVVPPVEHCGMHAGSSSGSAGHGDLGRAGSSCFGSGEIRCPPDSAAAGDASRRDLAKLVLGSAEMPSRGSELHQWGACKPCAFVFQGGCNNDVQCQFCHLCQPGERKRRKKERMAMKRETRGEAGTRMQAVPWNGQDLMAFPYEG